MLRPGLYRLVGDSKAPLGIGFHAVDHEFQGVQQTSRIAAPHAQQGLGFFQHHPLGRQRLVLGEGSVHKIQEHFFREGFQHVHLAARAQRWNHFKGWVFGRCADECHCACLDSPQQAVLLRFGEAMDLVNEQHRLAGKHAVALGRIQHGSHVFDPTVDGAQGMKWPARILGNQAGQCGLAHTRRAPQNHARQRARLHGAAQDRVLANQVQLARKGVERLRAHALCEWCLGFHHWLTDSWVRGCRGSPSGRRCFQRLCDQSHRAGSARISLSSAVKHRSKITPSAKSDTSSAMTS